ncbi:hypothetical protein K435DRAFT_790952 [Dendrothele bispora CBS 962.96]|uniref:Uncharacterized protein n=1 Tax=Dendrothele bispora (strain CBS 962.96) TaxID=1314807 RepID=A0A4S8MNM5_DENBC|nr:hypothetical protein K435DRAFT_790952 [Dendrothele bispora CBS 962.96]
MLFSRGTGAQEDWDYKWLLDCKTGMHLNQAYPLRGYQKFYEPDMAYVQINPTAISTLRRDEPVARTPPPSQIVHDGGAWDPSSMTPFPSLAPGSLHWTMHPNLDGKTFLAAYRSPFEEQNRVHAMPNRATGCVVITWQQKKPFSVLPEHIVDITGKDTIKPTFYQGGLLAVRGPHVGKYMQRIYIRYDDDEHWKEPWMICMVFNNLVTNDQRIVEDNVLVDTKDCAPCKEQKPLGPVAEHIKMVLNHWAKRVTIPGYWYWGLHTIYSDLDLLGNQVQPSDITLPLRVLVPKTVLAFLPYARVEPALGVPWYSVMNRPVQPEALTTGLKGPQYQGTGIGGCTLYIVI